MKRHRAIRFWSLLYPVFVSFTINSGFSREQRPVAEESRAADSLLIIGMVNNGASAQFTLPGKFGNRIIDSTPDVERAIEQALKSREPSTDITLLAEVNYFRLNKAEYFVPITIKIPGMQLANNGYARRLFLDFSFEVSDESGAVVQNFREAVDVRLSDETAQVLQSRQVAYDTGFTLLPGKYSIKFLVRDGATDRIGTYKTSFVIPNLLKEAKNLPISSVVLSSELFNVEDALSNSMQPRIFSLDDQLAADPLAVEGKKLIPSVTRTFSIRRDLLVFLDVYVADAAEPKPLKAFITLYRGQTIVLETPPLTVKDDSAQTSGKLPVRLRVALTSLPPGAYDCVVTILDPASQKSASWRSPINIVN
jgi:hypothetical protein